MSIELLWLIPVVAFALALLIIALSFQNRKTDASSKGQGRDLAREVDTFNMGFVRQEKSAEERFGEIETTISLVNSALSNQQKIIETFKGKDTNLENELNTLKDKLRELQQEYDIVISENYSMRARIKKFFEEKSVKEENVSSAQSAKSTGDGFVQDAFAIQKEKTEKKINLYDDTKAFEINELGGGSEIHISEIQ